MGNFYEPPRYGAPQTSSNGSSSIEARLAAIEAHLWHEAKAREAVSKNLQDDFDWIARELEKAREERRTIEHEMDEMRADRMALIIRVGMWAIGGLLSALSAIVFAVWKSGTVHG
ncbi:MAG: hypothetical protein C4523_10720 [Myxococcales bacterium]|nr:MAG: hypothetical protein C4523_10720 [Myxococcales bacterium]